MVGDDVLGQGLTYPLVATPQGRLQLTSGPLLVQQALQTILETVTHERVMIPGYGSRVGEFEPLDLARLKSKFFRDVAEHEPRVEEITSFDVAYGPGVGEATVTITYKIVDDANEHVLTYPIFVGP